MLLIPNGNFCSLLDNQSAFKYMPLFLYPISPVELLTKHKKRNNPNEQSGITKRTAKFIDLFQANTFFLPLIKVLSASASDLART